ncbi:MAG: DUF6285 domain-containing protein [Methyloligellaceae bacterium]
MTDRPPLTEMLEFARNELRTTLRSALPEEHKYTALMIANLIAIAVRTLEADPREQELVLQQLYELVDKHKRGNKESKELPDNELKTLGNKIRDGGFDPGSTNSEQLVDFLRSMTVTRVKRFNPRALD